MWLKTVRQRHIWYPRQLAASYGDHQTRETRPAPLGYSTYVRKEWVTRRPDFMTAATNRNQDRFGGIYPQLNAANDKGALLILRCLINHGNLAPIPQSFTIGRTASPATGQACTIPTCRA